MPRFRFPQRAVLVVVLAVVLAAPAAARNESRPRSDSRDGFVSRVLQVGVQLRDFFASFWEKEGCRIDPHGACIEGSPTAPSQTKEGCHIDPHGACVQGSTTEPPTQTDEGCGIDPHGGCNPG